MNNNNNVSKKRKKKAITSPLSQQVQQHHLVASSSSSKCQRQKSKSPPNHVLSSVKHPRLSCSQTLNKKNKIYFYDTDDDDKDEEDNSVHSYRTDNNNNNNNDVNNSSSSNCTDDGAGAININNNNNNSKKKNNNEGDDITTVTGVTEAEVAARAKAVFALVMAKARLDEARKKEKTLVMAKARLDEAKKKAEKKKIKEEAATEKKKIKAEKKKIKAEKKKIKEEAATEKKIIKAEKKKIKEEAGTEKKKIKEAAKQNWVDELGNPTPIYKYSIEEGRLINMKFSPNNPDEKKQYNSTKVFTRNYPMDLSLKKEQELALAWVGDKNMISNLQHQERDQQELQLSPQYIYIPDDGLHPAIDMAGTLRIGVKLLKLKSVNDKELMVLFCQAMDLLFTVRITHKSFWNAMLSDTDSYARDQAEGFYTWKGRFNNKFFCTVFLKILKSLHLTETYPIRCRCNG